MLSGTSTTEIHTCGYFSNTVDMDPGTATVNFTSIGNNDAFVQKITESTSFSKRTLGEKYIKGIECHIYPNPASQIMNVELGKIYETGNVSIMNIEGAVIMEDFINNQQSTVIQINEIPAGIYFIKITAPDLNKTIKFLKY